MAEITGTSGPVTKIDVLGGVPGAAGVSVTTTELDANGHLLIGKSNGVTLDVGKVRVDVTPEVQAAWDGAVAAETEATKQAGIATDAAANAKESETKAAASAATASGAAASEEAAKASETNAASSASSAAGSAETATTKAGVASSAATAAATSASNAALSESAAATSESNAETAASNAATSESNSATSAGEAESSASAAGSSATAASGSANAAALSASSASGSATAAATSAAQFSTWFLRGNGSPVGVVTPSSAGVQYVDLQATCGARVWISTGTTSSAWRVVDGDTGVRVLNSLLNPALWAMDAEPLFSVQRVGYQVFWNISLKVSADIPSGTPTSLLTGTIGAGFSNVGGSPAYDMALNIDGGTTYPGLLWMFNRTWVSNSPVNPSLYLSNLPEGGIVPSGRSVRGLVRQATKDLWPTTLPGTPA